MFFRVIKMKFCEQLNFYIEKLDCTAKELGEKSGLSSSTLSRYRSASAFPKGREREWKASAALFLKCLKA